MPQKTDLVPVEDVNKRRLDEWQQELNKVHATALLCIGIGHDHESGKAHLCMPDSVSEEWIIVHLEFVLRQLKNKTHV